MRASIACPRSGGRALERQRAALGDDDLQPDEVGADHGLGDRVLDLQARVHLQEEELAGRGEQVLDRAGTDVADRAARPRSWRRRAGRAWSA